MTKSELRKAIRFRLDALSLEERAEKSAALCREIAASKAWKTARTVGFFSPLPSEPDVNLLWAVLASRTVCYPRVEREELLFLKVPDRAALLESRWSLLEPPHVAEAVIPIGEIDLLLVPGLAFTRDGHRMGRGKGYYDRFLANPDFRAISLGVCFAEQIVPQLPMEEHDRSVSLVVEA